MESISLGLADEPVPVLLSDNFKKEILANAKYFKCEMLPALKFMLDATYDVTSWFTKSNGEKVGVIHTISGAGDPAEIFSDKIIKFKWEVCASEFKYKKETIKSYLSEAGCHKEIVYCLFEDFTASSSS